MNRFSSFIFSLVAMALGFGVEMAGATHPIGDQTTPTLPERLTEDIVKGRLTMIKGDHVVITRTDGHDIKLHVNAHTKLGQAMIGDRVKAYVKDSGHATLFCGMNDRFTMRIGCPSRDNMFARQCMTTFFIASANSLTS